MFLSVVSFIVSLVNIIICIAGLKLSRSIFIIFWTIALFIVVSISYDYWTASFSKSTMAFANFFSMSFNAIFLGCQYAFFHNDAIIEKTILDSVGRRIAVVCAICAVVGGILFFWSVPGSVEDIIYYTWQEIAASRFGIYTLINNISFFLIILSSSIIIPSLLSRKNRMVSVFVVAVYLLILIVSKTKVFLLPVAISILVYIAISRKTLFSWGSLKMSILFVLIFVSLYFGTVTVRYSGNMYNLGMTSLDVFGEKFSSIAQASVEPELTKTYYTIIEYFAGNHLLYGESFSRLLLVPLSFVFDINVPQNPMYLYGELIQPGWGGIMRVSNHPTIYGDAYANFGLFGIFLGGGYAIMIGLIWKIALSKKYFGMFAIISGCCNGIPLMLRGSVYYGIYGVLIVMLLGLMIHYIVFTMPEKVKKRNVYATNT